MLQEKAEEERIAKEKAEIDKKRAAEDKAAAGSEQVRSCGGPDGEAKQSNFHGVMRPVLRSAQEHCTAHNAHPLALCSARSWPA